MTAFTIANCVEIIAQQGVNDKITTFFTVRNKPSGVLKLNWFIHTVCARNLVLITPFGFVERFNSSRVLIMHCNEILISSRNI